MIACSCGRTHATTSVLARLTIEWRPTGAGDVARMIRCVCGRRICAELVSGACTCRSCGSLVRGVAGDPKIVVQRYDGSSGLYCHACACHLVFAGVDDVIEDARAALLEAAAGATILPVLQHQEV